MATTLKTLVLKTATVKSVKLGTPADRIGLGLAVAAYPADVQFRGQFPLPPCSGHRPPNSNAMRMHREEPAERGCTGRDVLGSSARRWPASVSKPTSRPMSRVSFPVATSLRQRIDDCQSFDRGDDGRAASTRETTPAAATAL
jgi:hypothetical protein